MALVKLHDDKSAKPEAREVFEDIRKTRNTDYVNNIWRALAVHPPMLKRFWSYMKEVMVKESKLDALTKEYIYLAVSITNNCEYCIHSHSAAARAKGMTDAQFAELLAVVGLANETNRLANGYRMPVDPQFVPHRD